MPQFLELDGSNGNWASTPQSTDFDLVAGEVMRYEVRVAMTDWTPAGDSQAFIASWETGDRDFIVRINVTSGLPIFFYPDIESTAADSAPGFTGGETNWLAFEVTPESSNGANDGTVTFEKSPGATNDPTAVSWTQISTHTSVGVTAVAHSNVVGIGAQSDGVDDMLAGNLYQIRVLRDSVVVAHFNANDFAIGATDTDTAVGVGGHTWTLHGTAEVKNDATTEGVVVLTDEPTTGLVLTDV